MDLKRQFSNTTINNRRSTSHPRMDKQKLPAIARESQTSQIFSRSTATKQTRHLSRRSIVTTSPFLEWRRMHSYFKVVSVSNRLRSIMSAKTRQNLQMDAATPMLPSWSISSKTSWTSWKASSATMSNRRVRLKMRITAKAIKTANLQNLGPRMVAQTTLSNSTLHRTNKEKMVITHQTIRRIRATSCTSKSNSCYRCQPKTTATTSNRQMVAPTEFNLTNSPFRRANKTWKNWSKSYSYSTKTKAWTT